MTGCIYCAAQRSKSTVRHDAASLQLQAVLLYCNELLAVTVQHSVHGIVYVASVTHSLIKVLSSAHKVRAAQSAFARCTKAICCGM